MAEIPCGCEGASILVDPCFFEHDALLAGQPGQELKPKAAPDRLSGAGGPNAVDVAGCGIYVPSNLQKLTDGNGTTVTGDGGVVPWKVDIALHPDSAQAAKIVNGKLFVEKAVVQGPVVSNTNTDEQLSLTANGLSAGNKHYAKVATGINTQPNAPWVSGQGGFLGGSPHLGYQVIVSFKNPSKARSMPVLWTVEAEIPYVTLTTGNPAFFSLRERAYLSSAGVVPAYTDQRQTVLAGAAGTAGKPSPLTYTASGIIPPNDTLTVGATLAINSAGYLDFTLPASQPIALKPVTLRIDILGSTT